MSTKILFVAVALLGLLLGGCIQPEQDSPVLPIPTITAIQKEINPASSSTQEDISNNDLDLSEEHLVQLAVADLSNRVGIPENVIVIEQVKPIEWPDATLGCPKPGMDFTPVVTPGYIILIQVDEKIYVYHTDDASRVIQCPAEGDRPDEIFIMP
jgi:hypothetical protein